MEVNLWAVLDFVLGVVFRFLLPVVLYGVLASGILDLKQQSGQVGWAEVLIIGFFIYLLSKAFCPDTWRQLPPSFWLEWQEQWGW